MEASIEDVLAMARDGGGVEDTEAVALGAVAEAHGWFVEITESAAGGTRIELSGIVPVERAAAV